MSLWETQPSHDSHITVIAWWLVPSSLDLWLCGACLLTPQKLEGQTSPPVLVLWLPSLPRDRARLPGVL